MSKGHELSQALQQVAMVTEQLEHLSQERELLLRTTEMYEVEKRELQDEVYSQCPLMYWERYGVLTETSNCIIIPPFGSVDTLNNSCVYTWSSVGRALA